MDEDQEQVLQAILSGHNLLLTGQAGTGKSYVIKSAVKLLRKRGDNVALTCSTGIATSVFEEENACTLHKWTGLSDGRYSNEQLLHLISTDEKYEKVKESILKVDYLFIDEISMISSKTLSQVEFLCRSLRDKILHFGGVAVILSGDFFQLPPVKNELYGDFGHHCFSLPWFNEAFSHHINLEIIHRQSENLLVSAVNELERGHVTDNTVAFLNSVNRPLPNEQLQQAIHLFARNVDVDLFNYDRIEKVNSQLYTFKSEDEGLGDYLQKILAPKFLGVKVGIPVMLLVNLSDDLVNGKIGTVTCVENDCIYVQFQIGKINKSVKLTRYLFTKIDPVDKIILAKRSQFPIKVAYAVTIHKSQGMSLESVVVDCKNASFPGQIGVAVGRAKSSDGLMVKNFRTSLIKPHPDIVYKLYENCSVGVMNNDFLCCKHIKHIIDENNNSDSSSISTNTCIGSNDTDEDTYNYFDEEKRASNSDFSDLEPDIYELIDEMEMPNNISKAFKQILEDFSDTPLHEATTKVKSETLQVLLPFTQWFDLQQNKVI